MEKTKKQAIRKNPLLLLLLLWLLSATLILNIAAATSGSGNTGEGGFSWSWSTDNTNTNAAGTFSGTLSENTLVCTVTANSSTFIAEKKDNCGNVTPQVDAAATTVTATVTNNTGSTIKITNITCDKATVMDLTVGSSLESGKSFVIKLTGHPSSSTATTSSKTTGTVTIAYTVVENVSIVFYGTENATYTYGEDTLSGADASAIVSQAPGTTITLPNVTVSTGTLMGWRLNDGSVKQPGTSVTIQSDTTVYPIVLSGNEIYPYTVNGTTYYSWEDAAYAAGTNGTIILNQNFTLPNTLIANGVSPEGGNFVTGTDGNLSYTIPSGVTLLIPYAASTSAYTSPLTEPERVAEKNSYVAPSVFRTLTIPTGVTVNCEGNIRVDGRQYSASTQYTGHVYGTYGKIVLDGGNISLSGSATLRAYGYITGSGTVTANTGTTVHELFQMADWRGGNNTSSLYEGMKGDSFLVSMFYVQNIESTLVLKKGAALTAHVTIAAGLIGDKNPYNSTAKLVASDGLFQLTGESAALTRTYSGGRVTYKVQGNATFGSISLKLSTGLGSFNMNSSEYVLNLPSNMTIQIASGTCTFPVACKLLPGTVLQIDAGATVSLEGTSDAACEMILYDRDDWTNGAYTYTGNFFAVKYSIGSKLSGLPNSPGQLIVNGDLIIGDYAGIYSTNAKNTSSGNAALSGTGKITISSSAVTSRRTVTEISGSSTTKVTVEVVPLLATLAGKSESPTESMIAGTNYTGLGANHSNRWYVEARTVAATCTTGGYTEYTCDSYANVYKANEIDATGHQNTTTTTVDATCTAAGSKTVTCNDCGATVSTEEIPQSGHSYKAVVTDPTCTEKGYTTYTCACGDSYVADEVAALGHNMVTDNAVDPSCEETGLTEGSHCTRCDHKIAQETVNALGHDMVTDAAVAPTCTATGLTEGSHCSRCNDKTIAQEVIAALGHTEVSVSGKDATCTETGLTAGTKCSVCGEVLTAQNVVDALGHKEETVPGKAATCEATGLTDGVKCSVCQETLTAQKPIDALGHAYTSQVTKPATCKEEGIITYTCDRDANHFYTETIEKLPHTEEVIPAVAPTCTTTGKTAGKKCAVCGEILEAQNVEAALDHDWDEGKITTEPTCSESGVKTYTCRRTNCGTTYTESVSALGHTKVTIPAVAPTCTATGLTDGVKCDVCGEILTAPKEVAVLGHSWNEGTVTTPAECTKEGVTTYTCQRENCDETKTASIAVLGHDWTALDGICGRCNTECEHSFGAETHVCVTCGYECRHPSYEDGQCTACGYGCPHEFVEGDKIAPTCKEEGYTPYTCSVCKIVEKRDIVAAGHKYTSVVTAPTCTEAGYTTHTCSGCGNTYKDTEVAALGHEYNSVVTAPTCTEDGYTTHTCSVCGDTYSDGAVAALGHTYDAVVTAPTCIEEGYTTYTCHCGHSYVDNKVEANGHTSGETVVENKVDPDCTNPGSHDNVVYCTACTAELSRETITVPALGHKYSDWETTKVANCTEDGEQKQTCVCGDVHTQTIPAKGHEWSDWATEKEASCTEDGSKTRSCNTCSKVETNVIPAAGHKYQVTEVMAPTCSSSGYTTYTCSTCGDSKTGDNVSNLGHTDVVDEAVEPSCTETGLTKGSHCSVCGEITKAQEEVSALGHNVPEKSHICDRCEETITFCGTIYRDFGDGQVKISNAGLLALKKSTFGRKMGAQLLLNKVDFTSDVAKNLSESVFEKLFASDDFRNYMAELLDCEPSQLEEVAVELAEHDTLLVEEIRANAVILYAAKLVTEMDEEEYQKVLNDTDVKNIILEKLDHAETAAEGLADAALAYAVYVAFAVDSNDPDRIEKMGQAGGWIQDLDDAYRDFANSEQGLVDRIGFVETLKMVTVSAEDASAVRKVLKEGYNSTDLVAILEDALNNFSHQCEICGETVTDHDYEITVIEPDCTEQGFTTYTCYGCNESYQDNYVDALTHVAVVQPGKEETCTESGLTEGSVCQRCGDVLVAQEVIPAVGHTSGNAVEENVKPATCNASGSYDSVTYCSVCEKESSRTTVTVPALKHKDDNKDHVCDNGCGEPQGEHTAASGSHNCGYCGEKVSDCADNNSNHNCDVCGEKLSDCADMTGDEDHKCDICDKDDITAHDWTSATYDSPKTCTECGTTMGDPLVRPVEIVKPNDVTAQPGEGISKEEVEEAMSSVIDAIVEAAQKTEQPETGINAEKNKTDVENAKAEVKDENQNMVTGDSYETSLVISLNAVVLDKDEEKVITKKVTFDVSPILYALDANGTKIGQTKITSFAEPITFRLPVAQNAKAKFARVLHEGVDDLGLHKIQTDAAGNRFVEVKAQKFSQFSLILEEECTDHNFVDGKCTICGAEEPIELFEIEKLNMRFGSDLALMFAFRQSNFDKIDGCYASVSRTANGVKQDPIKIMSSEWTTATISGTKYYIVEFSGFAAKEMTDDVFVTICDEDGKALSREKVTSIRAYAMEILGKTTNQNYKIAIVDMLNYGYAAQLNFDNYNINVPANGLLTPEQAALASTLQECVDERVKDDTYFGGSNLRFVSKINMIFRLKIGFDTYAVFTWQDHDGKNRSVTVYNDTYTTSGGYYVVELDELVVADARQQVTCTIYNLSDDSVVTTVMDTVSSNVARRTASVAALYEAFMKFADSAYHYLHTK